MGGKLDRNRNAEAFQSVERIGDANQFAKLPMKQKSDLHGSMKELDTVTPDILLNQCKAEPEGRKHQLYVFYTNAKGKNEWIRVAMPRYRMRKYKDRKDFEVVDCRTGKRKTFKRSSVRAVKKCIDRDTREWAVYKGAVDAARFR